MLDNPEKTARLLAALKAAVPFEVQLTVPAVKQLQSEKFAHADQTHRTVSDLYYAGDEGGILCHIAPPDEQRALFISLTSRKGAPHYAPCGSNHRLSEASSEEAKEAGAHAVILLPTAERFSAMNDFGFISQNQSQPC